MTRKLQNCWSEVSFRTFRASEKAFEAEVIAENCSGKVSFRTFRLARKLGKNKFPNFREGNLFGGTRRRSNFPDERSRRLGPRTPEYVFVPRTRKYIYQLESPRSDNE